MTNDQISLIVLSVFLALVAFLLLKPIVSIKVRAPKLKKRSSRLGYHYLASPPDNFVPDEFGIDILKSENQLFIRNFMHKTEHRSDFYIFDLLYSQGKSAMGGGVSKSRQPPVTMCLIRSENLNLPGFTIRPRRFPINLISKIPLFEEVEVTNNQNFQKKYAVFATKIKTSDFSEIPTFRENLKHVVDDRLAALFSEQDNLALEANDHVVVFYNDTRFLQLNEFEKFNDFAHQLLNILSRYQPNLKP